ncbi:MAG: type II toxin-antitoxin system HicA family toxin [Candidatus Pacebacteria bacterium]|nr:type II toxin-antitoxin system HicA family toxin [Candidatus Paceibacterota bacterium]MCF7862872.1 type II toxin-antitoxin system HicA family toxin [Candidatus Paceibacterota bacterium]
MPKLVPISPHKLIKILKKLGFREERIRGSHHFFVNPISKKTTTIPIHNNESLGIGILKLILKDINLSTEEYEKLRKTI